MRALMICLLILSTRCAARSNVPIAASAPVDVDVEVVRDGDWLKMSTQAYRQLKTNLIRQRAEHETKIITLVGTIDMFTARVASMQREIESMSFMARWGFWIGAGVTAVAAGVLVFLLTR